MNRKKMYRYQLFYMTLTQLCNYAIYNFALRENNLIVM